MRTIVPSQILVVDDDPNSRELLARRLGEQGHTVTAAEDGDRALEILFTRQDVDAVLLDIMMPGLDGMQVLQRMKSDERLRRIPVIMITALDDMGSAAACIRMGAEDHLSKPFQNDILQARLASCLDRTRLEDLERTLRARVEQEVRRANEFLRLILPDSAIAELDARHEMLPRRFDDVAVVFCDVVRPASPRPKEPDEAIVSRLERIIAACERIAPKHGIERVTTVSDGFLATAGLNPPASDSLLSCVRFGLEAIASCGGRPDDWQLRVGIHVGPVMAAVVGSRQYLLDPWVDTVKIAERVESHGVPGAVNVSRPAWDRIATRCRGETLGIATVNRKGAVEIVRVTEVLQ